MKHLVLLACLPLVACSTHAGNRPASATQAAAVWPVEVLSLRFAAANDIAKILDHTRLSEPATHVIADPRTNSLVVQGPDDGRRAARELVATLDVEARH